MQNFFRFAVANQNGTGSRDMAVDGLSPPQEFWMGPHGGERAMEVHRALIYVEDGGAFTADSFGAVAALANGVKIDLVNRSGRLERDLLGGFPIQGNGDWKRFAFDSEVVTLGAGDTYLAARWLLAQSGDAIHLDEDEFVRVTIQDDLSGLTSFTINFQGLLEG